MRLLRLLAVGGLVGVVLVGLMLPRPAEASHIYEMYFPIAGDGYYYYKSFGACRDNCQRSHTGIDIVAPKLTPVVAVADGIVRYIGEGEECCVLSIIHNDGWHTVYAHLNNDTPGTDDGSTTGYAPGVALGVYVTAGTLVGWVGDSSNSESTVPHLHFELRESSRSRAKGVPIDPWPSLRASRLLDRPLSDSTVTCDFNGDEVLDIAVSRPGAENGEILDAGEVVVMKGIAASTYEEAGRLTGTAELDLFGADISCGDVNGDGYDDLAVGAPGVDQASARHAGAAILYWGSMYGLSAQAQYVPAPQAEDDRFGATLAVADLDGDGFADLVIGAPYTTAGGSEHTGVVYLYRGFAEGLGDRETIVNSLGSGSSHLLRLGTSLWPEDQNGDGLLELVVGRAGTEAGIVAGSPVEVIWGTEPADPVRAIG